MKHTHPVWHVRCICVRWCSIFRYERFNFRNSKENKNLSFPLLLLKALINWTTYNAPINCTYRQHKTKQKKNRKHSGNGKNTEWVSEWAKISVKYCAMNNKFWFIRPTNTIRSTQNGNRREREREKRWTKVFEAHHHMYSTSKACKNTQWCKYVSFSVSSSTFGRAVMRLYEKQHTTPHIRTHSQKQ